MGAVRKLNKEYKNIMDAGFGKTFILERDPGNIFRWRGSFIIYKEPLDGAKIEFGIKFTDKYPFWPPRFTVLTKIYHPNVDERGELCMPIINSEHWFASQSMVTVMNNFIALINFPDPLHAFDTTATKYFLTNKRRYYYNAFRCLKKRSRICNDWYC
uniref:Ubiquitin-conjugating enzyme e2 l3 n=1 Tax=Triatoma infestans TaxID=30076 RepID=A0A170XWV5_TRIIF